MKSTSKSPCIRVCTIQDGVCIGCLRTLDEISRWSRMTDAEKININARIQSLKED